MNFDIKKHTINFAKSVFDRDTSLSVLVHWEMINRVMFWQ